MQHLSVSQDKWLQMGNFTYRFIRAENGGYTVQDDSLETPVNMTGYKIEAYLELLNNLGFWDKDASGHMIVTNSGNDFILNWKNNLS